MSSGMPKAAATGRRAAMPRVLQCRFWRSAGTRQACTSTGRTDGPGVPMGNDALGPRFGLPRCVALNCHTGVVQWIEASDGLASTHFFNACQGRQGARRHGMAACDCGMDRDSPTAWPRSTPRPGDNRRIPGPLPAAPVSAMGGTLPSAKAGGCHAWEGVHRQRGKDPRRFLRSSPNRHSVRTPRSAPPGCQPPTAVSRSLISRAVS